MRVADKDDPRVNRKSKRSAAGNVERQVRADVRAAHAHQGDGGQGEGAAGWPETAKCGGAEGDGDTSMPGGVPEPGGRAATDAGPR
jgi:hypothetical protein